MLRADPELNFKLTSFETTFRTAYRAEPNKLQGLSSVGKKTADVLVGCHWTWVLNRRLRGDDQIEPDRVVCCRVVSEGHRFGIKSSTGDGCPLSQRQGKSIAYQYLVSLPRLPAEGRVEAVGVGITLSLERCGLQCQNVRSEDQGL